MTAHLTVEWVNMMQDGAPDIARTSIVEQVGATGRVAVGVDAFARMCETLLQTAAKQRAPALFVGIGRYSDIGTLITPLARYPGQIVVVGASDVALPGYANFLCIEVPDDAPLSTERFMFARAESWAELLIGIPNGRGFQAATIQDTATLNRVSRLMAAFAPDVAALMPPFMDGTAMEAPTAETHAESLPDDLPPVDPEYVESMRVQLDAERAAIVQLEEELLKEQELRSWIEGQLIAERKARIALEQTTIADLDRLLLQARARREERAQQLEHERSAEETVAQELRQALTNEQETSREIQRQLFSIESQREQIVAGLNQAQAEWMDAQNQWRDLQTALEEARRALSEIADARAREDAAYADAETRLAEIQSARSEIEHQITLEPEFRAESEARLNHIQQTRAELDDWIAQLNGENAHLSEAISAERTVLIEAQRTLDLMRTAREYAEYSAINEVTADDGLPPGSFVRDLRLFVTRLRERIARLKANDATSRQIDPLISEMNTVIDILSEIGLIAGRETIGRRFHDVGAALDAILSEATAPAAERGVTVQAGLMAANVSAIGDSELLTAALQGAILSAIHLSAPGSVVRVDMGANINGCLLYTSPSPRD